MNNTSIKNMAGYSTYFIVGALVQGHTVLVGKNDVGPLFSYKAPGSFNMPPLRQGLTFKPAGGHLYQVIVTNPTFIADMWDNMNFDWDSLDYF